MKIDQLHALIQKTDDNKSSIWDFVAGDSPSEEYALATPSASAAPQPLFSVSAADIKEACDLARKQS